MRPKAVVLLSGGLDSSTVLAMAQQDGFEVHALSFRYGQRHSIELVAAANVAAHFNVTSHQIIDLDLRGIGGSALTSDIEVPKHRSRDEIAEGIPVTYVPARNTIFLAFAFGWTEVLGSSDVYIGVNALDYSGYPDCRPEFIEAFETVARLGTAAGATGRSRPTIHTPLIALTKAQIIAKGLELGVPYVLTRSCYDPFPDGDACGSCDSCLLRRGGFEEAGTIDPAPYRGGLVPV